MGQDGSLRPIGNRPLLAAQFYAARNVTTRDHPPLISTRCSPVSLLHMPPTPHEHVVRSASVVSAAVLLSRLTGLAREIVMARLFRAGVAMDAFVIRFRIPNLTRDLFAEGALWSAFVPAFTTYLAAK